MIPSNKFKLLPNLAPLISMRTDAFYIESYLFKNSVVYLVSVAVHVLPVLCFSQVYIHYSFILRSDSKKTNDFNSIQSSCDIERCFLVFKYPYLPLNELLPHHSESETSFKLHTVVNKTALKPVLKRRLSKNIFTHAQKI
jgi:hypothetical protein